MALCKTCGQEFQLDPVSKLALCRCGPAAMRETRPGDRMSDKLAQPIWRAMDKYRQAAERLAQPDASMPEGRAMVDAHAALSRAIAEDRAALVEALREMIEYGAPWALSGTKFRATVNRARAALAAAATQPEEVK